MDEYKSNSHKSKETQPASTEKNVEKVIRGTAKKERKSGVRKLADIFISEDIDSVKSYVLLDVLVPALKKAVSDIVTNGIDMILYGESGRTKNRTASSKVSYSRYYDSRDREPESRRINPTYGSDDISVESRGEAEDVLYQLETLISRYGMASIGDLYDLVGITVGSGNYTVENYGWTDISRATIVRVKDRYLIKMPRAKPLN